MNQIITYFTFNGNCREAMEFYKNCLGGELNIQTIGDSPEAYKFPKNIQELVLQASLKLGAIKLMGTDMNDDELVKGNAVSILLDCSSESQANKYYKNLKKGGISSHPIKKTYLGDTFGGLTDKYGHHWLLYCRKVNNR
ncbi:MULTISPECIES: VOC family protein [Galbibacter]|uniref:VOC family protein n=1 Tax=Galbibacter pacificus TaxID=2996052 RepID=A0ABT6FP32_9FLAO|nr:VOC family protein [Galbibacter pacificus]MDG3581378.1 VOC family protein [Galbibacter pacificus]MDG3584856.1 VOC family protein [Galbibacter pacificus]